MRVANLTPEGVETVKRGIAVSRKMLEASSRLEEILITQRDMLDTASMEESLRASAGPYKELEVFNSELMTLHTQHVKPSRRQAASSRSLVDYI